MKRHNREHALLWNLGLSVDSFCWNALNHHNEHLDFGDLLLAQCDFTTWIHHI